MSDFMDGNSGPDPTKKPLLFKNGGSTTKNGRRGGLSPRNSYKSAFLSMLPDKVRSGFVTDEPPLSQGEKEYYERQLATLKSFEEVDSMEESEFDRSIVEEENEEQAQQESNEDFELCKCCSLGIKAKFFFLSTVLIAALKQLIEDGPGEKMSAEELTWLCSIMIYATAVKLILWLYCRSSGNKIVRAYADDHHLEVITKVVGLVAAVLGDKFYWWVDPVGAMLLALYTISNWSHTVMENAVSLVGQSASPEVLQKLTYPRYKSPSN